MKDLKYLAAQEKNWSWLPTEPIKTKISLADISLIESFLLNTRLKDDFNFLFNSFVSYYGIIVFDHV